MKLWVDITVCLAGVALLVYSELKTRFALADESTSMSDERIYGSVSKGKIVLKPYADNTVPTKEDFENVLRRGYVSYWSNSSKSLNVYRIDVWQSEYPCKDYEKLFAHCDKIMLENGTESLTEDEFAKIKQHIDSGCFVFPAKQFGMIVIPERAISKRWFGKSRLALD